MSRVYVVTELRWNYQTGAADFGYYSAYVKGVFTTYSAALKLIGKMGFQYYSIMEDGWWFGDGLYTIQECVVEE